MEKTELTIEQVGKMRQVAADKICEAVSEFEGLTGIQVNGINLTPYYEWNFVFNELGVGTKDERDYPSQSKRKLKITFQVNL